MGQVDHHPKGVHLGNHLLSERTQAVPALPFGSTVGNGIVTVVRERHIADTETVKGPEQGQRLLDGGSVLHADKDRYQPVLRILPRFIRRESQGRIVRVRIDGVIDGGNHLQRIACSCVRRHFRRGIQGEKRAADSPAPEFGEIDVPIAVVDTEIPEPDQLRRGIDVAVKDLHHFVP